MGRGKWGGADTAGGVAEGERREGKDRSPGIGYIDKKCGERMVLGRTVYNIFTLCIVL